MIDGLVKTECPVLFILYHSFFRRVYRMRNRISILMHRIQQPSEADLDN